MEYIDAFKAKEIADKANYLRGVSNQVLPDHLKSQFFDCVRMNAEQGGRCFTWIGNPGDQTVELYEFAMVLNYSVVWRPGYPNTFIVTW